MPKTRPSQRSWNVGSSELPNDRAEELGSAAHVARRGHGATIHRHLIRMTGSNTGEFSGGAI